MSNSPIFRVQVMRFSVPRCRVQGYMTRTSTRFCTILISIHNVYSLGIDVSFECISQKIDKFYQLLVLKWGMIWVNQMKRAVSIQGFVKTYWSEGRAVWGIFHSFSPLPIKFQSVAFRLAKQQLRTCSTPFCTCLCRHCKDAKYVTCLSFSFAYDQKCHGLRYKFCIFKNL